MKRRKPGRQEQYCVVISSESDIRKQPAVFSIKRRFAVIAAAGAAIVFAASATLTVMSVIQSARYSNRVEALETQVDMQSAILDAYSGEIDALEQELGGTK